MTESLSLFPLPLASSLIAGERNVTATELCYECGKECVDVPEVYSICRYENVSAVNPISVAREENYYCSFLCLARSVFDLQEQLDEGEEDDDEDDEDADEDDEDKEEEERQAEANSAVERVWWNIGENNDMNQ